MKKFRLYTFTVGGIFLLADQIFKLLSTSAWQSPYLLNKFFGWRPFLNYGVGFGLPVPNRAIIFLTIIILGILIYLYHHSEKSAESLALCLIFSGALSNLFDRLAFGFTRDYFLLGYSLINLGDCLIVVGFILWLLTKPKIIR